MITASGTLDGWTIRIQGDRVDAIHIRDSTGYGPEITQANAHDLVLSTPYLGLNYDNYVVLPPPADLPVPPTTHDLSTRTGHAGVDALIALFQAGDTARLYRAVATPDTFKVRQCEGLDSQEDTAYTQDWATRIVTQIEGIESVAMVPEGYSPHADHILVFTKKVDRYWWQSEGVLERDGEIVGIVTGDACTYYPEGPDYGSYGRSRIPPGQRTYLIPPPAQSDADMTADRNALRTGVSRVDSILDAMEDGDKAALASLTQFTSVGCGPRNQGPDCPEGSPDGTPIDAFPISGCNGGAGFSEETPSFLTELLKEHFVYVVVSDEGSFRFPGDPETDYLLVLSTADYRGMETIGIGSRGVTSMRGDCGYRHPEWLTNGGEPDYLLSPP